MAIRLTPGRKTNSSSETVIVESSSVLPKALPVVSLRQGIVFPHTDAVLVFERDAMKKAITDAQNSHKQLLVVGQKHDPKEEVLAKDLYKVGCIVTIQRVLNHENELHVLVSGNDRVKITNFVANKPFFKAEFKLLPEKKGDGDEFQAKLNHLVSIFKEAIQNGKPVEFMNFLKFLGGQVTPEVIDHVAATLDVSQAERQALLEELNQIKRLDKVLELLLRERNILEIEEKLTRDTKKRFDKRMRENILRERMQAIQKELGEIDDQSDLDELYAKLDKSKIPPQADKKIEKELRRLEQMSPMQPEYSYIQTWLDTVLSLPWNGRKRERISLRKGEKILNDQHHGLEKVKERILEHLAVHLRRQKAKNSHPPLATILCFVGPPGVGKTSIGRSIAEALNREFIKISLGGVRDEAELRGHRRTYVGAMPGRIMESLRHASSRNPVIMLDEIDKLGADFRGDPASALLEILDPEQNKEFVDHYIDLPFDLSEVFFITTANVLHTIPPALLDRLEIIEYSGYTHDEKHAIAEKYLWPKVLRTAALSENEVELPKTVLRRIITAYTREAGVRQLQRELAALARKAAKHLLENKKQDIKLSSKLLEEWLGPPKFLDTQQELSDEVGLVNGLAWTSVGGEILPIEASLSPGKGGVILTGQLGKVMQESAKAALTFVRAHAKELDISEKTFDKNQLHVHVPEGAVPKDGPSAGVAMATVMVSVATNRKVDRTVGMTGEITLRGRVLPIGGLKEKLIAAHRAGLKTIFIPEQNKKDLVDVPKAVREALNIIPVEQVSTVLKKALVNNH